MNALPRMLEVDNVEDGCLGHSIGEVVWNTTYRCNLQCKHCYLPSREPPSPELSFEEACRLIDDTARTFGSGAQLVFSGGEPLLRGDIYELVEYAHSLGLRTAMASNGALIGLESARRLKEAGLDELAISVDGDEPVHDRIRGVEGSFSKAVEAALKARSVGISLQLHFTLTAENEHLLPWIIELAERLGARRLFIFDLIPVGRGAHLRPPSTPIVELFEYVFRRQSEVKVWLKPQCSPYYWVFLTSRAGELGVDEGLLRSYFKGCLAGCSMVRVTPEGHVTPCPFIPISVGSVRGSRLWDILESSEALRRLRLRQLTGKCGVCEWRSICGGCRAKALAYAGDLYGPDPRCPYC